MLKLGRPLRLAFWPLVPLASCGRIGLFSQTSPAADEVARHVHVVVFEEDDLAR